MEKGDVINVSKDTKNKVWKQKLVILAGGSLYYYSNKTSYAPSDTFNLKDHEIIGERGSEGSPKPDKKNVIVLKEKKSGSLVLLAPASAEEKTAWLTKLVANKDKEPSPIPENPHAKGKGAKYALENNIAGSMLGKKFIKESVDQKTWDLLDAVCNFIKAAKGEETSKRFRKDLIKFGTKIGLLYNNKMVSEEVLRVWRHTLLKLSTLVVDYYQMPSIFDSAVVSSYCADFKNSIESNVKPKLSQKSMDRFYFVCSVAMDIDLLADFFTKGKWNELETVATYIRYNMPAVREAPQ